MNAERKNALMRTYGIENLRISDTDLAALEKLDSEKASLTAQYANVKGLFQARRRKEIEACIREKQKSIDAIVASVRSANNAAAKPVNASQGMDKAESLNGTLFKNDSIHIYLTGTYSLPILFHEGTSVDLDIAIVNNSEDHISPYYTCEINGWTVPVSRPFGKIESGKKVKQEIGMPISDAEINDVTEIKSAKFTTHVGDEEQTVCLAYEGTKFVTRVFRSAAPTVKDVPQNSKPAATPAMKQDDTMYLLNSKKIKAFFTGKYSIHEWMNRDDTLYMDVVVVNDSDRTVDIRIEEAIVNGYVVDVKEQVGYDVPAKAKKRNKIDLDFMEADISRLSELKTIRLKTRAVDSSDYETIIDDQEVEITFKGSSFITSPLPEAVDMNEVITENAKLIVEKYNHLHNELLPKAHKMSHLPPKCTEDMLHVFLDVQLQAFLYNVLLNNRAINEVSIAVLNALTNFADICACLEDEPEEIVISWEGVPDLSDSAKHELNGYFEKLKSRSDYFFGLAFSSGDTIDEIRSGVEETIRVILTSIGKCIQKEISDTPRFLPMKIEPQDERSVSPEKDTGAPENQQRISDNPVNTAPMDETESYVRAKYSHSETIQRGAFALNIPQGWTHTSQGDFDFYYSRSDRKINGGYLAIQHADIPSFRGRNTGAFLESVKESTLKGCKNLYPHTCRYTMRNGKTAMVLCYSYNDQMPWVASFMILHGNKALQVMYTDPEASITQINAMGDAIFSSITIDRPVPVVKGLAEYQFADYDRYNCPDEDRHLTGEKIIIEGIVEKFGILQQQTILIIQQPDGKKWHVTAGIRTNNMNIDGSMFANLSGRYVRVLGEFRGYIKPFQMPGISVLQDGCMIDMDTDNVIQTYQASMKMFMDGITQIDLGAFSRQLD